MNIHTHTYIIQHYHLQPLPAIFQVHICIYNMYMIYNMYAYTHTYIYYTTSPSAAISGES